MVRVSAFGPVFTGPARLSAVAPSLIVTGPVAVSGPSAAIWFFVPVSATTPVLPDSVLAAMLPPVCVTVPVVVSASVPGVVTAPALCAMPAAPAESWIEGAEMSPVNPSPAAEPRDTAPPDRTGPPTASDCALLIVATPVVVTGPSAPSPFAPASTTEPADAVSVGTVKVAPVPWVTAPALVSARVVAWPVRSSASPGVPRTIGPDAMSPSCRVPVLMAARLA